jgi:hypothetical protein
MRFAYDLKRDEAGLHQSQVRTVNGEVLRPQDSIGSMNVAFVLGISRPPPSVPTNRNPQEKETTLRQRPPPRFAPSTVVTSTQLFDE